MAALTNSAEYIALRVKEHKVQAKVRIRMGAIIWIKPLGTDSKLLSKSMEPRIQKYRKVNTRPIRPPMDRPTAASASEKELTKSLPSK